MKSNGTFELAVPVSSRDHHLGPGDARVTVVEYGDFECPACQQAYGGVKILLRHYRSDVRFVFRNFPLRDIHPHAEIAAEAAETAGSQGVFWQYHDMLFERRSNLTEKALRQFARLTDIDMDRYDYEMRDHHYLQRVQEHIAGGLRSGVRGTPTFYVNGSLCDTSFGLESLRMAIEATMVA